MIFKIYELVCFFLSKFWFFFYDFCCNFNILLVFVNLIYKYFIYCSINGVSELICIELIYSFIRYLIVFF